MFVLFSWYVFPSIVRFLSFPLYEGPYGRRVSKGAEGVEAWSRYQGLQFSSLYLRQGESLPHDVGEGIEGVIRRSSDRLGHRHIGLN